MAYFVRLPKRIDEQPSAASTEHYLNIVNGSGTIVQRELRRKGFAGYEPQTAATMCAVFHFLAHDTALDAHEVGNETAPFVFFDVGANGGYYSSLCKSLYRDLSEVAAFEPTPDSYHWLDIINRANRLNMRTEHCAVSNEAGEAEFFLSEKSDASNSLNKNFKAKHKGSITVPCIALDSYVTETECIPSILKIDTETHEESVLRGAEKLLREHHPILIMEAIKKNGVDYGLDISAFLSEIGGYRFFHIGPDLTLTEHSTMKSMEIPGHVDWLIAPSKPGSAFMDAAQAWATALAECGPSRAIVKTKPQAKAAGEPAKSSAASTPTLKQSGRAIIARLKQLAVKS